MNNLRYKDKTPTKYYYGATEIPSIYYGSTQVYSQGTSVPYKQLESIELTDTQWINTTEQLWNTSKYTNWKIDFNFTPTAAYNYNAIFGTANDVTTFESWIAADKNFYFRYNGNKQTVANITPNTRYNFVADYTPSTLTFTINGTSKSIPQSAGSIASDLYVGRRGINYGKFKIHSLKLYGNGVLVRDFIPCEYEGAIGLWDKVNNQFYGNAGEGNFIPTYLPQPYTQLDYIDFTQTTYINTETYPNLAIKSGTTQVNLNFSLNSTGNQLLFTTLTAGYSNTFRARIDDTVLRTVYGYNSSTATVGALELNRVYIFDFIRTDRTRIESKLDNVSKSVERLECNSNSTPIVLGQGNFRCYSCKITINDILMRNYIPVIKNSDSKTYMLDTLHNQFYPILNV